METSLKNYEKIIHNMERFRIGIEHDLIVLYKDDKKV